MIPLVLRAQLDAMCKLREDALDWKDPEGVHDMRVLSRRLRSAVSDFKPYFRKASLSRNELRAIADSLGDVRDEDVALIALEKLKSKAKGTATEGIEMLAEEIRQRRKLARSALKQAIKKSAVNSFHNKLARELRTLTIAFPRKPRAERNEQSVWLFREIGIQVIKARLKDFVAASPHLYAPFEIKDLHGMRILAKRLRYAIELFGTCWGDELEPLAKEVSLLQTSLGELHDCDVWIESLGSRLKRATRSVKVDEEARKLREGAAWLFRHFVSERMQHYRDAITRWEQWRTDAFLESLVLVLDRDDGTVIREALGQRLSA